MRRASTSIVLTFTYGIAIASVCAADVDLVRYQLSNGIRVVIGEVPDAQRQAMFTFLPLTLANDDADRAQWAHLVEHMLIRVTDPMRLSFQGVQLNGETTHQYLRLESFAEPAQWLKAMERHQRWLVARQLDPATLPREQGHIQEEEQSTSQSGYTSKFALAAWNQIVIHGRAHAAVHGDVAGADFGLVQQYVANRVPADDSVLIATIGPEPVEKVAEEIDRLYGKLDVVHSSLSQSAKGVETPVPATSPKHVLKKGAPKQPEPVETLPAQPPAAPNPEIDWQGQFIGTWDFPTRHVMWWWPLPDESLATVGAANIVGRVIMAQLMMSQELKPLVKLSLVYPSVGTSRGSVLLIDCSLLEGASPEQVEPLVKTILNRFAPGGQGKRLLPLIGTMILQELMPDADFTLLRSQLPAPMRGNAEGVWLLAQMNYEYPWSAPMPTIISMLTNPDQAAMDALVDNVMHTRPGRLVLQPAAVGAAPPAPATQPR